MAEEHPDKKPSLVLGVLGGMGPAATLDFLKNLQAFTPAKSDQDHIRVHPILTRGGETVS